MLALKIALAVIGAVLLVVIGAAVLLVLGVKSTVESR